MNHPYVNNTLIWHFESCSVLQFVAVCCSVLQCVAVCCSMLHGHLKSSTCGRFHQEHMMIYICTYRFMHSMVYINGGNMVLLLM